VNLSDLFITLQPGESVELHRSADDDGTGCIQATADQATVSVMFDFVVEQDLRPEVTLALRMLRAGRPS
jgi:hypothetical protein